MDRLTRCTREWQWRSALAGHALAVLAVWFRDFPDYLGRLLLIAFGGDIAERQDADQPLAAVRDRQPADLDIALFLTRSDARRVGKAWVSTGRSRWSRFH